MSEVRLKGASCLEELPMVKDWYMAKTKDGVSCAGCISAAYACDIHMKMDMLMCVAWKV